MIDRWQQMMNSNSSCSTTSTNSKSNYNKKKMETSYEAAPPVPVERKNSISLMDALLGPPPTVPNPTTEKQQQHNTTTVDDVWNKIVAGGRTITCKQEEEETDNNDTMMTLEDFLAKAGAVDEPQEDVKFPPPPLPERLLSGRMLSFDNPPDNLNVQEDMTTRGKRRPVLDPLQDKAAQQRQRRMIKNRESAARSRERKQAYQAELESLAFKLEEENETLMKAKEEQTRTRYKQLMDNIIPVTEKRRPTRYVLKKVRSMEW
ncbi:G-box-binding factor 4-like protein [Tanacetum coccineum]|uniref:G-box-binding factor 4-like protein n=1 Tax=Tanacetum coccineum TaxID=301880 RepID=A0ABQ5C9G6_9ASTR